YRKLMYRFSSFFIIFVLIPGFLFAQEVLNGKIVDSNTRETLPGAYVFFKSEDGETLGATVTDGGGNFQLDKPTQKSFILEISYLGYEDYSEPVTDLAGNNLGTIELNEEGALLE